MAKRIKQHKALMSSRSKSESQGEPRNKHFHTVDMPVYEGDPKESYFQKKKQKQHLEWSQDTKSFFYILVMIVNTKTHSTTYNLLKKETHLGVNLTKHVRTCRLKTTQCWWMESDLTRRRHTHGFKVITEQRCQCHLSIHRFNQFLKNPSKIAFCFFLD